MPTVTELDLALSSGTVHAARVGPEDAPLVLCVHGLSANLHSFDYLVERIASDDRQVVAIDLRGRGRSETTPPGSYGLTSHARDALEVATLLGAARFDYIGWSLGALVGLTAAGLAGDRLRSLTMIDHCGTVDPAAYAAVRAGLRRLDAVVDDPADYVAAVRAAGAVEPWNEYWDRVYRYEIGPLGERFAPVTNKAACQEDLDHAEKGDVVSNWAKVTMPALLLRATGLLGGGLVVSEADAAAFQGAAPGLRVLAVERNHFGIMTDDGAVAAIADLLGG
ncbi:MAG TPA: alpha/beta hydrolase [Pseudonocardia sp.]|jgi:pimeloyl-ACP methyl ester carboxylesterase|nr:alpha/beta hydrolase [Pseudonocardia sp.]